MSVQTVTGKIRGDDLGVTLTHEHLHMHFDCVLQKPPKGIPYPTANNETFQLQNLGVVRQYPYSSWYNCHLDDKDTKDILLDELSRFKQAGGKTIAENTTEGISRNVQLCKELSVESGVNIVVGTGFYVACSQNQASLALSVEEMRDTMVKEITEGVGDTGIRCGMVGEIGCSWPLDGFEKKALQAAAQVQQELNPPVTIHPGRAVEAPFEIVRIFTEAGGKAEDIVMSHLDRTLQEEEDLLEFAKLKTICQFDFFGLETSYFQLVESIDHFSDSQRMDKLRVLIDHGHLDQITISHDIHTKHRMANFGGHGYAHILQNVVPKMKSIKGYNPQEIEQILIQTPKRWLARGTL